MYQQAAIEDDAWSGLTNNWYRMAPSTADSLSSLLPRYAKSRACLGERRPDLITYSYWNETFVHASLQQFPESFQAFDAYFSRFRPLPSSIPDSLRGPVDFYVSRMYRARGFLHYLLGNLTSSIGDYVNAIETNPEDELGDRLQMLIDLGIIVQRTNDFESARRYYRKALSIAESTSQASDQIRIQHARAIFDIADSYLSEMQMENRYSDRRLREALRLTKESQSVFSKPGTYWNAFQHNQLSSIYAALGQYDRAYDQIEEALSWARATSATRDLLTFTNTRARIDLLAGNYAAANRRFRDALAIAQRLRNLDYQRRTLYDLGRVAELQQDYATAESHYRDAIEVVEEFRSSLRATQWSLTAFDEWQDVYRGLTRALLAQNRTREAFRVLERTRARHLIDLRTRDQLSQELSSSQRVRFDSLTRALTGVRNRLAFDVASTRDSLRRLESKLVAQRRQLLAFDRAPSPLNLDSLQAALRRDDRTLVSYFIDDPFQLLDRSPRSHAFVVTPDSLQVFSLPGVRQSSIQADVEAVSPVFSSQGESAGLNAVYFDLRPLHALYRKVFAPLEGAFSSNRVTIVPDGALYHIPFAAFVAEAPAQRFAYDRATFLLDRYTTSVELSASLLLTSTPRSVIESKPQALVAFGVSTFEPNRPMPPSIRASVLASAGVLASSGEERASPSTAGASAATFAALPGVRKEIRSIRALVSDGTFVLDEDATEARFHQHKGNAKILHLASHALVHPTSPLYNAFVLSTDSTSASSDDGWLFLHEMQSGPLGSSEEDVIPLVVLSGCSTARGTLRGGEGMEGLQYAFRAMGAQATVSNLWSADDRAAVELVRSFYRYLQDGLPKDHALRRAQADYLADHPNSRSPFFWSNSVFYGDPRPLPLASSPLPQFLRVLSPAGWVLLVFLLGGLVFGIYRAIGSRRPHSPAG
jgi:CHAT domain-containing protein/tetratricopeptide (TPR) repeat protein